MSGTCAVMLVKDEVDILAFTLAHLLGQVDAVIVSDNGSADGSRELVGEFAATGRPVTLLDDPDPAYYQDRKTTRLARRATDLGFDWVLPVDADEFWYATDGRRIADYLAGLAPDVAVVEAPLFNHIPTALDPSASTVWATDAPPGVHRVEQEGVPNPFQRIGWRQREHGALGKVAARALIGLEIRMGNHAAYVPGGGLTISGGLVVRHFSWRTAEQYTRKIANGARAYAATDMPADFGKHWRMFGDPDEPTFEERTADHFRRWFWRDDPYADGSLIYDPAPVS